MSPTGRWLLACVFGGVAAAHAAEPTAPPEAAGSDESESDEAEGDERDVSALPLAEVPAARPAAPTEAVPRLFIAGVFGASVPLAHLGPGVAPAFELGGVLDPSGRFSLYADLAYSAGTATGVGTDPVFPDGYTWSLSVRTFQVAPGVRMRVLPWGESLSPEVAIGGLFGVSDTTVSGAAGGAAFPDTREAQPAFGGFLAGGLVGRVGPGTLEGRVSFTLVHLDSVITGEAWIPAVTPAIGYRVSR